MLRKKCVHVFVWYDFVEKGVYMFYINVYIVWEFNSNMKDKNDLWGEERKVVSARLYRSEFANFMKICESEGKSVNEKLREMVREEVKEKMGGVL